MKKQPIQAEISIGVVGHVDHGKTSLVKALTEEWADTHSEEIKRGITIKLGYADADIVYCDECKCHTTNKLCRDKHGGKFVRKVSFVDCPGHETLMAIMLSGAAIMDGAMLIVAANEKCPQPQTIEHLSALNIAGIKNIIVVQNKVDLVTKEQAKEHSRQIKEFLKGSVAENAPIIPVAAHYNINIEKVVEAIQTHIKTPVRNADSGLMMYIARSFDINKPNTDIKKLVGGVIGGSIIEGTAKIGDKIEIAPGVLENGVYRKIETEIASLSVKEGRIDRATAGGLVGIGTPLDPYLTKGDSLVGNVVGTPGKLPPVLSEAEVDVHLLERVVGFDKVEGLKKSEMLVINFGTGTTVGVVDRVKGEKVWLNFKKPICVKKGGKIAISRRSATRWHLIGYGIVK
ncbi:MAG: translation initiation factor IF-2 subunit gamma [Candidatus Micrarchaeota archaeon]